MKTFKIHTKTSLETMQEALLVKEQEDCKL